MATEWDEIRGDFPALSRHVMLNAAGCSPTPRPVREAVDRFHRELEEDGDLHWETWVDRREDARVAVARLVGADPDEIAFVPNTSTGMNLVADLVGDDGPVLTNEIEFPAVTLPWIQRGVTVHFLPAVEGVLRLETFQAPYAPRASTIAISHVQFSNGCRQDLDAFGALKEGRWLVVSASQSAGAFPIDVKRSGVDALACAGHKWLCAGYGASFVYMTRAWLERRPRQVGWMSVEHPFRFDNRNVVLQPRHARAELGCPAFGGALALGAAVRYLLDIGIDAIAERVLWLNRYLTFLLDRAGFEVLSPGDDHRSGQTLVALPDPFRAAAFLRGRGVVVTRKPQGLRIATHFYNNEADVDAAVSALKDYRRQPAE